MSLAETVAQSVWIRRTVGFAGSTCLFYDYFLTLDREVAYIWNAPWGVNKIAFLINRYANLFGQIFTLLEETGWIVHNSADFCQRFNLFSAIFPFLSAESVHILVILRAWAIWGCKRRIAVTLIGVYLAYLLLMLAMTIFGTSSSEFQELQHLEAVEICIDDLPPYVWTAFVASFILDTVVFGLTMWSLRQHLKEFQHLYPSSFVRLLVRDASIFYLVSVFYNGFIIVTFTLYASDPKSFLGVSFCIPLLSIAGQRLVLNLRGLTVRTYSPRSISAEVDRQLAALEEAQPEWWQDRRDSKELEIMGAEASGARLQDTDVNMVQDRGDAEGGLATRDTRITADARLEAVAEIGELDDGRRLSTASQTGSVIVEVLRLPDESRTPVRSEQSYV